MQASVKSRPYADVSAFWSSAITIFEPTSHYRGMQMPLASMAGSSPSGRSTSQFPAVTVRTYVMQNRRLSVPMLTSVSCGFLTSDFCMREFPRCGVCRRHAQRSDMFIFSGWPCPIKPRWRYATIRGLHCQ